jgi:hypothetical protein
LSCEKFDRLINLFLDGRLDQKQEEELKGHLSQCPRCAEKLAFLESVERKARGIEAKEPSPSYWDDFSTGVRDKIAAREESTTVFGLKKALESFFTFSPMKIKVAAGLVSIVLVFLIGKLYLEHEGKEMIPPLEVVQTEEQPRLDITEIEEERGLATQEIEPRGEPIPGGPETEKEAAPVAPLKKQQPSPPVTKEEKEALSEKPETSTQLEVVEIPAPAHAPAIQEEALGEAESSLRRSAVPEEKPVGAGIEGKIEKDVTKIAAPDKDETRRADATQKRMKAEEPTIYSLKWAGPPQKGVGYSLNEIKVHKLDENDTLGTVDDLSRTIQVWRDYIEQNPSDSLTKEGYLQIGIAYYLLAKITGDSTSISQGSEILKGYIEVIEDTEIKAQLEDRVSKIEALRKR